MSKWWLAAYGFFLAAFVYLGYLAHQAYIFPGDIAISSGLQAINWPPFHATMLVMTFLGYSIPAGVTVVLVTIWLLAFQRKREAIFIVLLSAANWVTGMALKGLIRRPRPVAGLDDRSFPSGHTLFAVVFYGFIFYLAPGLIKSKRAVIILRIGLALIIILTAASRIHLGEHWPSDVLGSFILGGLLLAPALALYCARTKNRERGVSGENA